MTQGDLSLVTALFAAARLGLFGVSACVGRLSFGPVCVVKRCLTQAVITQDANEITVQPLSRILRPCCSLQLVGYTWHVGLPK